MPENNPSNQSAKEWAKASEIRANIATEKAELATQKATESLASANKAKENADAAKTSETAAKSSETKAKASETAAKSSETKAKASETNAGTAANKATTEANRAKTEADRAKNAADSVGNPVVSITQSGGNLTVTKGDGSSNTLTVTPAKASQAEAEAGTDDIKMMTPLKTKEAILANIATDAEATAGTDNTKMMTPLGVKGSIKANAPIKSVNGVVADADGNVSVGLLNGDADTKGIKQFRCFIASGENCSYWYLGSTPANTTGAEVFDTHTTSLRVSNVGSFGNRYLSDYEVYITPRYATPSIQAFQINQCRRTAC